MRRLVPVRAYVEAAARRGLDERARRDGLSRSEVIASAIDRYLAPSGVDEPEGGIVRRMDRQSGEHAELLAASLAILQLLWLLAGFTFARSADPDPADHARAQARRERRSGALREALLERLRREGVTVPELVEALLAGLPPA